MVTVRRLSLFVLLLFASSPVAAQSFVRGDTNGSGTVDIADVVFNLDHLFNMGPAFCLDAHDVNDDGMVDLSDAVFSLSFSFNMGMAPSSPFPDCGTDPTMDTVDCATPPMTCAGPPPTAFRITSLDIRDPHVFLLVIIACLDSTDTLNGLINDTFVQDTVVPGILDASYLLIFRPLDPAGSGGTLDFAIGAECTAPAASTTCDVNPATVLAPLDYTNNSGVGAPPCLAPLAGTTNGSYTPPIATPNQPCFVTDPETLTLDLGGILFTLQDAQLAGSYQGSPATGIIDGLGLGFVSEADAALITIPAGIPVVGGLPLTNLLPGGSGNCSSSDDRDLGPDGTTLGWWFYFNFTATEVPYTGP